MRRKIVAGLAYVGAALTLVIAICVPFVLYPAFTKAIGKSGLHIEDTYTGGAVERTIARDGFEIEVHQAVRPRALERIEPFVEIVFKPLKALPGHVDEAIDLDGDGQPDVRVSFDVPADAHAKIRGDVTALNGEYRSLTGVGGNSFSRLLVRTDDSVVVRVPLNEVASGR